MKKVKLAKIATAIMVAGVVSAPASALANEAQVAQASAEKTEVVAETEAAAEVTEEAPAAEETPAVTEEVVTPVAPVEEVTPEAPAVAETTKPEVVAPKAEEATAPKVEEKAETKVDTAAAELAAAKQAAYDELDALAAAGIIDDSDVWGWGLHIQNATSVEQVKAIMNDVNGATDPSDYTPPVVKTALEIAKEEAHAELEALYDAGHISHEEYWGLGLDVDNATTVSGVKDVLDSIGKTPVTPEPEKTALEIAKEEALAELEALYDAGYITYDELWGLGLEVEQATSVEAVDDVLNSIGKTPVTPEPEKTALEIAKEEALAELEALYDAGYITYEELWGLGLEVEQATTVEAVEDVLNSIGKTPVTPEPEKTALEIAKEEALAELEALYDAGYITYEELWGLGLEVEQATTVGAVEDVLNSVGKGPVTPEPEKTALDIAKEDAFLTIGELLGNDDISSAYYNELATAISEATTVEAVEAVLDGIVVGEHKSELEKAKIAAFETIGQLLADDDISVEYYNELSAWISIAESVEEVDFILDGIVIGAHKSELEKAKAEAFETIGDLLANDYISVEYYNELATAISEATTVEDVEDIIAGIYYETPEMLEAAKTEAFENINQLLTLGYITVPNYLNLAELLTNAVSIDEVNWILDNIVCDATPEKTDLQIAKGQAYDMIDALLAAGLISEAYHVDLGVAIAHAATLEELEAVMTGIVIDQLVLDTTDLEALIAEGKTYNEAWFTAASWSVFAVELDAAEEFLASTQNRGIKGITQAEVDAQVAALEAAINQLVEIPHAVLNLDELLATIDAGNALVEAKYTAASWSVFAAALDHAELFVANTQKRFEAITQAQVDAETAALKAAIAQLILVKVVDPTKPVEPVKPIVVTPVVVKPTKKDDKKVVVTKEAELPQTGEKENALLAAYGLTMAALAGLFISKRKKEENI